jgi:phage terminase large subunit-like protein
MAETAPSTEHHPLVVTPTDFDNPGSTAFVPGAYFDQDAVDKVVRALESLKHTKTRKWAGQALKPELWQLHWIIEPVFGWKQPDGNRIIRTVWIEVPRKNGKSTISSGFAIVLLCADGETGAEVYAAAGDKAQAGIVHGESSKMAKASIALRGKILPLKDVLTYKPTGGIFRVLSKVAEAAHGLNVSGAVIDEVHVHKTRDLIDAIETGTGAREQPLVIFITTADEGDDFSIYGEKHEYTRKVAAGHVSDPTHYGVIWAAEDDDDPFAEATWEKANPGIDVTIRRDYLRKEAAKARAMPSYFPTFCRLHLNRRMRATSRWLRLDSWDRSAGLVVIDDLRGQDCFIGLDLSTTTDLTSMVLLFPQDATDDCAFDVLPFFWLPDERAAELVDRDQVPYDRWAREGYLHLTEGTAVDYDVVTEAVRSAGRDFQLKNVSHDPWQAAQLVQELQKSKIPTLAVPQSYAGMGVAAKELEKFVLAGRLHHGGHPVLRWNADCVEVMRDNNDNIRPVKPKRDQSSKRVDGITALVMSIDGWLRRPRRTKRAAGF